MKLYPGWRIVALAALTYVIVIGFGFSSLSIFVLPVSNEFGLTRAQINTGFSIIGIGNALWAPLIGWLIDRVPLRLVMGISIALMGMGCIALGLSHSLLIDVIVLATCISIGLDGSAQISLNVLVARWFRANRSLAMTLAASGQALGKISVPPMVAVLVENFGWRSAILMATVGLFAVLFIVLAFIRERPTAEELASESIKGDRASPEVAAGEEPRPISELLRQPNFWYIALSNALAISITFIIGVSLVPLAQEYDVSLVEATTLGSAYALSSLSMKLLIAKIADMVDRFYLTIAIMLIGVPLWPMIYLVHDATALWVFFIAAGFAVGTFVALFPILQVDTFGLASFGTVRGLMIPVLSVVQAVLVPLVGHIYDVTGSYDLMFIMFSCMELVIAALVLLTRRTLKPAGGQAVAPAGSALAGAD